jgi:hypothetical protein
VRLRAELAALLICAGLFAAPPPASPQAPASAPTETAIDVAVEKVRKDPNLAEQRTVRTLDWKFETPDKDTEPPDWLEWIVDLFRWIGEGSRVLMWIVVAALIGVLAIFVVRVFLSGRAAGLGQKFVAPTHVQDLDIRPESLPDDVGAAARALWDAGDRCAALALLYRGMLSRLAHVHEVPIRASSTEGDCLALAARKLDAREVDYVTRLVRSWQRAIYGGVTLDSADVHALCAEFARHLDAPPAAPDADRLARAPS